MHKAIYWVYSSNWVRFNPPTQTNSIFQSSNETKFNWIILHMSFWCANAFSTNQITVSAFIANLHTTNHSGNCANKTHLENWEIRNQLHQRMMVCKWVCAFMWFLCVPFEFELEISMPICMNQIKSNHFILISHSVKCSVNLLVVCTLSFSPNSFFEIKKNRICTESKHLNWPTIQINFMRKLINCIWLAMAMAMRMREQQVDNVLVRSKRNRNRLQMEHRVIRRKLSEPISTVVGQFV